MRSPARARTEGWNSCGAAPLPAPHERRTLVVAPTFPLTVVLMAAMTIAAPLALAGARPAQALRRRAASVTSVKTVAPVTSRPGALQVRAAIAMPGPETPMEMTYNETGKWREAFDLKAWAAEIRAVEKELKADIDQDDVDHLNKILTWANAFYFGGLAIMFATPFFTNALNFIGNVNPIAAFMMSTAICARWTMVGHHVCHGGYNTAQSEGGVVTGLPPPHLRQGPRPPHHRLDGLDDAEAWDVEHNHLHHYQVRPGRQRDERARDIARGPRPSSRSIDIDRHILLFFSPGDTRAPARRFVSSKPGS